MSNEPPMTLPKEIEAGILQFAIDKHDEMELKMKPDAGEKGNVQKQCPVCKLWFFPSEY